MNTYRKEILTVMVAIVFVSLIVTYAIETMTDDTQTDIKYPMFLSIIVILFSFYTISLQGIQSHRQEEIRLIEKSLENFYIPLQNMFIENKEYPIDCYQEQKTKFLEIGCYRHLAESNTFDFFNKVQQDNEYLKILIKRVDEDIDMLQKKYKEKNKQDNKSLKELIKEYKDMLQKKYKEKTSNKGFFY